WLRFSRLAPMRRRGHHRPLCLEVLVQRPVSGFDIRSQRRPRPRPQLESSPISYQGTLARIYPFRNARLNAIGFLASKEKVRIGEIESGRRAFLTSPAISDKPVAL